VMALADFRGLSHLGIIASGAMFLITLAYYLMLPALVFLLERRDLLHARLGAAIGRRLWEAIGGWVDKFPRGAGRAAGLALLIAGAAAALRSEFNYDFESLMASLPDSERVRAKQSQVYPEELTPGAVFLAPDEARMDRVVEELKRRRDNDPDIATIGRIASIRDFLPGDQPKRLREIRAAAQLITPAVLEKTSDPEQRALMEELRNAARLEPIESTDLPEVAREFFLSRDGSGDTAVFVFPSVPRKQGDKAIAFAKDMAPVEVDGQRLFATGDMLIFAETLRAGLTQGQWIFLLSLLIIAGMLLAQLRRIVDTLRVFLALLAGLGLMLVGLLAAHVDINFYNVVLFAGIVGMGVDYSVHLYHGWLRARENRGSGPPGRSCAAIALAELGGPITSCALTTCAGYLGMVYSYHPGLHGIGMLAVIGLMSCFLVALTVFPVYLREVEGPP
jgi:uncharacterized protein